jgi:alpha-L-rhamnosidase
MLNLEGETDRHYAVRGEFSLATDGEVTIHLGGHVWFDAFLDGEFFTQGPSRAASQDLEWERFVFPLAAGNHVLALHAHVEGITTRLWEAEAPPCIFVEVMADQRELAVAWKDVVLPGFVRLNRRKGCVLGWAEWRDTRLDPVGWEKYEFLAADWRSTPLTEVTFESKGEVQLGPVLEMRREGVLVGEGALVTMSMHDHDPPMAFAVRDLAGLESLPPNGVWRRWDLGRVRLGRPQLELSCPRGALVQIGYAEQLLGGRVVPYLNSGGGTDSCLLDTWIALGGRQVFRPLHPNGARFLELHVLAPPAEVEVHSAQFVERCYYHEGMIQGRFTSGDAALDRIWAVGVDTLMSCSEDAITDNPTRERGQWLGDVIGPGMEIVAVAFEDLRPIERGLRQAAQCAGEDGMIPAVFPGTREFLPTFALQWPAAVVQFHRLSGNRELLADLHAAAVRNLDAFAGQRVLGGLRTDASHWNFVDWGYAGSATVFAAGAKDLESYDPALSLFYLSALRAMATWSGWLNKMDAAHTYEAEAQLVLSEMREQRFADFSPQLGFHAAVLALREQIFDAESEKRGVRFVKDHILRCFPNDPDAPRLADTRVESTRLITPFFLHFALQELVRRGEIRFVLDQMKTCWGWMLAQGVTTWMEVFDPRWSHCHQWSGCPTWILSRYLLGLFPRFDLGPNIFDFTPYSSGLEMVSGQIPLPGGGVVSVENRKADGGSLFSSIQASQAITLRIPDRGAVLIESVWEGHLPGAGPSWSENRKPEVTGRKVSLAAELSRDLQT